MGDGESPVFFICQDYLCMDRTLILKGIESEVTARGCFIVDISVTADNDIVLTIESEKGTVEMDDCVVLSDKFQEIFDRDKEDYSLTVTSAGLDQPFKILKQYLKAIGSEVIVLTRDGRKLKGVLKNADENGFVLSYETKETVPGKKKKESVQHEETFAYSGINSVTPYISIE